MKKGSNLSLPPEKNNLKKPSLIRVKIKINQVLHIRKNIFACLFSVHNTISLLYYKYCIIDAFLLSFDHNGLVLIPKGRQF